MNLPMNLNDIDLWEKELLKGFALPLGFLPEIGEVVNILEPFKRLTIFEPVEKDGETTEKKVTVGIIYRSDGLYAWDNSRAIPNEYDEAIVTPKTSAGVRIVPMLSEVKAALQAEWETQKIVGFNESIVDGYTGFIFQNRYGDPLSPHSVNRAIDRICAAYIEDETVLADQEGRDPVLIRHFSAHNLRHTFCTRFCENERNIKVIQEIMGHADIETTMNIYAEATKEKKKESFSNLEGKIKIS